MCVCVVCIGGHVVIHTPFSWGQLELFPVPCVAFPPDVTILEDLTHLRVCF